METAPLEMLDTNLYTLGHSQRTLVRIQIPRVGILQFLLLQSGHNKTVISVLGGSSHLVSG